MSTLQPAVALRSYREEKIILIRQRDPQTDEIIHEFSYPYEMEIPASPVQEIFVSKTAQKTSKKMSRAEKTAADLEETGALFTKGLAAKEIAKTLKVTVETVYNRLSILKKQKKLVKMGDAANGSGEATLGKYFSTAELKNIAACDSMAEVARKQNETYPTVNQRFDSLGAKIGRPKFTAKQTFEFIKQQICESNPIVPLVQLSRADVDALRDMGQH